jgi:membrane associated rhomboid family serine protease
MGQSGGNGSGRLAMGIHDRDYYRESSRGMFDSWGRQGVTVWLIAVCCGLFLADLVTQDVNPPEARLRHLAQYSYQGVVGGEVWRLLTPIFLNFGLLSLAFNMWTIYWAGSRLEDRYGGREFLFFFLAAGLFAYTSYFLTQLVGLLPPNSRFGPGPAIIATLVLFACHYPREQILLMMVIPIPVWLLVVLYVAFDVYASRLPETPIAFSAYLGGALFGLLYYQLGWRIDAVIPTFRSRSHARAAPRLRVVTPEPDESPEVVAESPPPSPPADAQIEARVDRVLEKVSKYGQESLTSEEREILFRASELYKKRRK